MGAQQRQPLRGLQVAGHHLGTHLLRRDLRNPAKLLPGLGCVAEQCLDLSRTEVARVDFDDAIAHLECQRTVAGERIDVGFFVGALPFEAQRDPELGRGPPDEVAHRVLLPRGDDEVFGLLLLQHHPLHADIVPGVAPIAHRVEVAHVQALLQSLRDVGQATRDLAGDEGLAAARALVVEQDPVAGVDAVGLAVVDGDPVGVELGDAVGTAGMERRRLGLRGLGDPAEQLAGRRLVEAGGFLEAEEADSLEQPQRADCVDIRRVLGHLETDGDVGLGAEVVDLVRANFTHQLGQVVGVAQVAVVQLQLAALGVRVLVDAVDAPGVERGRAADDAVDLVALAEQELREVRAVLSGDAGDESATGHRH